MDDEDRRVTALDHMHAAKKAIAEASEAPDPVRQRKLHVLAAGHLRIAADFLDDHGRITE